MPRMHRSKQRYVNPQVLYAIIVALVGIGIVVGLQTPQWKNFVASYEAQPAEEETENTDNEDLEFDDFDLFLKEATIQQLIFRASELGDDPKEDVLDRLERHQQKIRIAERLLSEKSNQRAKELGTIAKLTALRAREWLNFDYGFTDPEQLDELLDFSVKNAASDSDRVKQNALQGRLSARIIQYLRSVEDGDADSYQSVLKEFQTMCDQNVEESDVASDLLGYLQRIHLHTMPEVFEEFAEAFKAAYGNSDNEQVRKTAEEVKNRIIGSEFRLTDVFASTGTAQELAVEQLHSELVNVLQSANISQHGYQKIVAGIVSLARLGYYKDALEASDMLRRRVAGNDLFRQALEDLSYLRGHWQQVGQPFSYESLATLNGEPFQPRNADFKIKAILFLTPEEMEIASRATAFILSTAKQYVAKGDFLLTVVLVSSGEDDQNKLEMSKMANLIPIVDFGFLDQESVAGKKLLERLEIRKPPLLLLLDQDDRITGIDINTLDLENRINRLMSAD